MTPEPSFKLFKLRCAGEPPLSAELKCCEAPVIFAP